MTYTILSFALTMGAIVGLVLVAITVDDADTRATLLGVLTPLATSGAWFAARGEPMRRSGTAGKGGAVLLVLALLVPLGGCARTFTVAQSDVHLSPYGTAGIAAKLTADDDPVCTVTGTRSSLTVDRQVAERICKAWPTLCTWRATP